MIASFAGARRGFLLALLAVAAGRAQTPAADRLPPAGIAIPDSDRAELTEGAASLRKEMDALATDLASKPRLIARLPDIEIFHKAVDWALRYDEFFDPKQVAFAKKLLEQGNERAKQLRAGQTPWLNATGLVVRGYRSQLDGSIQPYGLVVPAGWNRETSKAMPLTVWLAGRNEKRTELAFLNERESSPGPMQLSNAIVLHPYGRFCNATKFAGEVDVFEAKAALARDYRVDSNRVVVAGFSMGGASAWHLAVHHSGLWCAASPGAGFAETAVFAKAIEGSEKPPWWEQKLWRWYDATVAAGNLFNCPTIAYSGEIDGQKQAADIMETAMAAEGLKLERLIGPQTAHKYHPDTLKELTSRLEALIQKGRDRVPKEVRLTTYSLRYPEAEWVRVEGLEHHWERADVRATLEKPGVVKVFTTNVSVLELSAPNLETVTIDGRKLSIRERERGQSVTFSKRNDRWYVGDARGDGVKSPGLTGPIDDAFLGPFLFVRPTGKPLNDEVGNWAQAEMARATNMWRAIFRGDVPVKDDVKVSAEDTESKNLVVWGDPSSNRLLATMLEFLPIEWDKAKLVFRAQPYDAESTVPILIFPNPLNRKHYVVLNSGIDFRNDAYGSNARQTPKLPDWAIVDIATPPGPRWPGKIVKAGFFDERWK